MAEKLAVYTYMVTRFGQVRIFSCSLHVLGSKHSVHIPDIKGVCTYAPQIDLLDCRDMVFLVPSLS